MDSEQPTIAKITSHQELETVCTQLQALAEAPSTARVADKNELKTKIEVYLRKMLVELTSKKKKGEQQEQPQPSKTEKMERFLEFLLAVDKALPWREFYSEHGFELFTMLFKCTFYGRGIQYSVHNQKEDPTAFDGHDGLCWVISQIQMLESQINYVINNLLTKQMLAVKDKFQMLLNTAELMYSQDNFQSTKRIAKVMAMFSRMYSSIGKNIEESDRELMKQKFERNKFLRGSLFAIGGLLKIEAKSYIVTLEDKYPGFCVVSNPENELDEAEKKFVRKLSEDDAAFFRNEFHLVVSEFIESITQGLDKEVNKKNFNLLLDLTYEKFYDEMMAMEDSQPRELDQILCCHFSTKFLTDFISFAVAYFVEAASVNTDQYLPGHPRVIYDHRGLVSKIDDGRDCSALTFKFIVPSFQKLIQLAVNKLNSIWTDHHSLLTFWCTKYVEDPLQTQKIDLEKDSYDRRDNYNEQGIALFAYFNLKEAIDAQFGTEGPAAISAPSTEFIQFQRFNYFLEALMPSVAHLIGQKAPQLFSQTFVKITLELMGFLLYQSQQERRVSGQKKEEGFSYPGYHTKFPEGIDLFLGNLFALMGNRQLNFISNQQGRLCMKIVYGIIAEHHNPKDRAALIGRLFTNLNKADSQLSLYLSSYLKPMMLESKCDDFLELATQTVLPWTLDVLAETSPHINDMTGQLQCSLNLLVSMNMKYKTNPKYESFKKELSEGYLANLYKAIATAEGENAAELKEAEQQADESVKAGQMSQARLKVQQLEIVKDLLEMVSKQVA